MRRPKGNMRSEHYVKRMVREILVYAGWKFWMPSAGVFGRSGVSDFLAVKKPKLFMAIETKYDDVVTAAQFKFLTDMHEAGHYAFLVDETNVEELRALLTNDHDLSSYPVGTLMKWRHQLATKLDN
jgi:hypothetical protein